MGVHASTKVRGFFIIILKKDIGIFLYSAGDLEVFAQSC